MGPNSIGSGVEHYNQLRENREENIKDFIAKIQETQNNNIHIDNKLRDEQNSFAEEKMKLEQKNEEYTKTSQQVSNIIEGKKDGYFELTQEQIQEIKNHEEISKLVVDKIFNPNPGISSHELLSSISKAN